MGFQGALSVEFVLLLYFLFVLCLSYAVLKTKDFIGCAILLPVLVIVSWSGGSCSCSVYTGFLS